MDEAFSQPLNGLASASPPTRPCPDFSDEDCLRLGVQRVLVIHDKAGIDFACWKRRRQECAVYFISQVKENLV